MLHLARSINTSISRCLMAGLACGILAAVLHAGYIYLYGSVTDFTGGMLLSPLPIFIGVPLLYMLAGFILFEMVEYIKKGRLIFMILLLLLTTIAIILASTRYGEEMEGLMLGIILINGLLLSLLLPYLATHAKIFMDKEEFSESADT
jgi:hypothetical protein